MSYKISNITNENKKIIAEIKHFSVIEYQKDLSVNPITAPNEYYMSKMNVKKRQVLINLEDNAAIVTQAGAMQYLVGNIDCVTGVKGVGDLLGKMMKSAVTNESAIKPLYTGKGQILLEPTYKHILLQDMSNWPDGMTIEDGMFLACDSSVEQKIIRRNNLSSAVMGGEGLFNLSLDGKGIVALESNVPLEELIIVELDNDTLKVDGNLAICWSSSLNFTVERSSKTLIGSAFNGEGLVNVYRGTGKVYLSPVASSSITITPFSSRR